jgi:hypothetical protein
MTCTAALRVWMHSTAHQAWQHHAAPYALISMFLHSVALFVCSNRVWGAAAYLQYGGRPARLHVT